MKLSVIEKRAQEFCARSRQFKDTLIFTMEWKKSKLYDRNPVVKYKDKKIVNVTGCGYDKESQALADILCYLFDIGSSPYLKIKSCGGCGFESIVSMLHSFNWNLKKIANTKDTDTYSIEGINNYENELRERT